MNRLRATTGRRWVLGVVLAAAVWGLLSRAADPGPAAQNREPVLVSNAPGGSVEVLPGARATLIVEASDPDRDARDGEPEAVQLLAEWSGGEDETRPGWLSGSQWTAQPSAHPRLEMTFAPGPDAPPGQGTLLVGATDRRGLTAQRTFVVRVLTADDSAAGGSSGGDTSGAPSGGFSPGRDAPPTAVSSDPHVASDTRSHWTVSLALNAAAGSGNLLADGYLTAAERASGGGEPVAVATFTGDARRVEVKYARTTSDPGACAAGTGKYLAAGSAGVAFADFTLDGPYFICAEASDALSTAYAGPVTFTVDTAAPKLDNATFTIADPHGAHYEGRLSMDGGPYAVFVKGDYAYLALHESDALAIVDVSDPARPKSVATLRDGEGGAVLEAPSSVFVRGAHAYVTSERGDALQIVDVSDPTRPAHAGTLEHGQDGATLGRASSVFVRGDYAYVTSHDANVPDALEIADVRNPSRPRHVSSFTLSANWPRHVYVKGSHAYVALHGNQVPGGVLEAIDLSDPTNPVSAGTIRHDNDPDGGGGSGARLAGANSVAVRGDRAYVAALGSGALQAVDVSNPAQPRAGGALVHDPDGSGARLAWATAVTVKADHAYVAAGWADALEIADLSDALNPAHARAVVGEGVLDHPNSVFVRGNRAYVASGGGFWALGGGALDVVSIGKTAAGVGTAVAVELDASEEIAVSSFKVNGVEATDVTQFGSHVYATYTVGAGDRERSGTTPYEIRFTDRAGQSASARGRLAFTVDTAAPTIEEVELDATTVTLRMSEPVWAPRAPAAADFAVLDEAGSATVGAVAVAGSAAQAGDEVTLTLSRAQSGASVTVKYTPNASSERRPRDVAGNTLAAQRVQAYKRATLTVGAPVDGTVLGTDASGATAIDCGSDCSVTAIVGSVIELSAEAATGHRFERWRGACSEEATASCKVTLEADKTVGALFGVAVPGPVENLAGTADSDTRVSLAWDAPTTGGTPSGYTVSGSGTIAVSGTGATITELEADTEYTWTVTADNDSGSSTAESVTVTTQGAPGPIRNLTGTADSDTQVSLDWDAPNTGGAPTGYTVTGSGTITVSGTAATVTGLSAGTPYTFSVTADNSSGSSPSRSVTVRTVPGPVKNLSGWVAGSTSVTLDWGAPDGGAPTGYTVTGSGTIAVSGTGATVTGLTLGTTYTWSVTADNDSGSGASRSVTVVFDVPGPVRNLAGTADSDTQVSLAWDAPDTGGAPTGYTVSGSGTITVSGTAATVTGLSAGTSYTFSVTANNNAGSSPSRSVTVPTKPGPVNNLSGWVAGSTSVTLDWGAPDGGAPTGYTVSGSGTIVVSGTGATVTGLTLGTTYTWSVTADNDSGSGASRSVTVVFDVPGAVGNLSGSATGSTSVSLDWDAPNTGGAPTGYTVTGSGTITVSGTAATVTGLSAGTPYTFSVTADNNAGSSPSRSVTVRTVPGPVKNLSGWVAGSSSVTLDWDAPDGGAPTGYTVSGSGTIAVSGTGATVTGLTLGTTYTWSVTADNDSGSGASLDAIVVFDVPGAVGNLSGSATGSTSVSLDWDAPNTGGAPTGYTVTGSGTITVSGTAATVTGLSAGTPYTFSVTADNNAGSSPSRSVTVRTVPGPVKNLSGWVAGSSSVTLDWDAPDGGAPTGYTVTGSGTIAVSGTGATVTGLTLGTTYTWSVTADNDSGSGASRSVTVVFDVPGPVRNLAGTADSDTQVSLAWDAPDTGGAPTGYTVSGSGTITVSGTAATVTGLSAGTSYTFSVTANNNAGSSPSRSVTVPTKPGPVNNLSGWVAGSTSVTLDWGAPDGGAPTGYTVSGSGTIAVSGTGATVTGLTLGTTYTWSVTADNDSGSGASRSVTVVFDVPGPVSNLASPYISSSFVRLSWDAPNTGGTHTSYSVSGGGTLGTIYPSGSVIISNLTANTAYTFTVTAVNAAGSSTGQTIDVTTAPTFVRNLSLTSVGTTTVGLDWDAPASGAASYTVTGGGSVSISGTSATVSGLTDGSSYTFTVTANNSDGNSGPGATKSVTTGTPDPVSNLASPYISSSFVRLSWDAPNTGGTHTSYSVSGGGTLGTIYPSGSVIISNLTANTAYTFTVTAVNAAGSSTGQTIDVTTAPTFVRNLSLTSVGTTTVGLDWDAPASGAASYTVTGGGSVSISGTSATVSGLTDGSSYTFTVTANNSDGNSGPGATKSVTTGTPDPVNNLASPSIYSSVVRLRWDAPNTGGTHTSYSVSGGGTLGTIYPSGIVIISNLTANTAYTFTVTAVNAAGSSTGQTIDVTTAPTFVRNLSLTSVGTTTVGLDWDAPASGAASYTVTGGGSVSISGTSATVSGLTDGSSYTFTVTANNSDGNSGFGLSKTLTTGTPDPVNNLASPFISQYVVRLSWDAPNTGGTHTSYSVSGGGTLGTISPSGSVFISNLTANTAYTFTVTAVNAAGSSTGQTIDVTTAPTRVRNLSLTSVGTTTVGLDWDAPASGAASYTVTGGGSVSISGTSATVSGLTDGSSYTFTVTANNSDGNSGPGATKSVTTGTPDPVSNLASPNIYSYVVRLRWDWPNTGGTPTTHSISGGGIAGTVGCFGGLFNYCTVLISNLTANTAYTFTVTAVNAAGWSTAQTINVTTLP